MNWNSCTEDDFLNSDISPKRSNWGHSLSQSEQSGWSRWHYSRGLQACWWQDYFFSCTFILHPFTSGENPEAWTEAIILPLNKKDSIHDPDNYSGTSLLNVCSKLYSNIINKRLSRWAEDHDVPGDIQAGFRKDHSTIDHIFTLFFSMIQRQLLRNKKSYVAFIDFRKAFDLIAQCKLWPFLSRTCIKGKMLQTIQSIYKISKVRARNGSKVTDAFFFVCFFCLPERPKTRENN